MTQSVPVGDGSTTPSVHNVPTKSRSGVPNIAKQLQASAEFIIEGILGQVLIAFGGVSIFGVKPFAALAILGKSIVDNANAAYSKSVTAQTTADAANTKSDNIIDAILSGISGQATTGGDPAAVALALINQTLSIPITVFDDIWAALAALTSHGTAVQNSPAGTVVTDDFSTSGVSGYTNIVGTIAVSGRGPYVQTANLSVAYRNQVQATEKHSATITLAGNMQGSCGAAICSDTTASNYAALLVYTGITGDSIRLVTGSSPTLWVSQKEIDLITTRVGNGNVYKVWYEPAINTFHVLRNGTPLFDWPDTTNIVTHGSTKRRVLLMSNVFDINEDGFYGPGIAKVTGADE